jgi:hypothetical protein
MTEKEDRPISSSSERPRRRSKNYRALKKLYKSRAKLREQNEELVEQNAQLRQQFQTILLQHCVSNVGMSAEARDVLVNFLSRPENKNKNSAPGPASSAKKT